MGEGRNPGPHTTTPAAAAPGAAFTEIADGVELAETVWTPAAGRALSGGAVHLVALAHRELDGERRRLLAAREDRARAWDSGERPDFLDDGVVPLARAEWQVAPIPSDLLLRRVEITGPVCDPKLVVQMLSRSDQGLRADAAMLDFEDSMKPSWPNVVRGLLNLHAAAEGSLSYRRPAQGDVPERTCRIDPSDMPVFMVRGRGLHLDESNLRVDGVPVSAGLFDLCLSVWHTSHALLLRGRTPKFYVPKVEHHLEARWWNRLFGLVERELGLPSGCLRVTFLIETLPAAFQMEEVLWEVRERAAGLNVGRWDKIFSDIKCLKNHPDRVLADRGSISLNRPWMRDYAARLVAVCHRHGAFAMGGMAAFTPGRSPERREEQAAKVLADKQFEASLGHDGCWVSHPFFIAPALAGFPRDRQLDVLPVVSERPDLLPQATPPRTMDGLRKNVRVGIAYVEGWNRDVGCIAWDDLMEDLATLEISRAQTWQWLRHAAAMDDGPPVTRELVDRIFREELDRIVAEVSHGVSPEEAHERRLRFERAASDARAIFLEDVFRPFLSLASDVAS